MSDNAAAREIGLLVNHILALAPDAGLYVSIRIEPLNDPARHLPHADHAEMPGFTGAGGCVSFHETANSPRSRNDHA